MKSQTRASIQGDRYPSQFDTTVLIKSRDEPAMERILRCRVSCTVKCYAAHIPTRGSNQSIHPRRKPSQGSKAVITGADFPEIGPGLLQIGEKLCQSTATWLLTLWPAIQSCTTVTLWLQVAAISTHIAEEALTLITVEYEPLPFVQNVLEAMRDTAVILHPDLRTAGVDEGQDKETNIANHIQFSRGDLATGFAAAEVVIAREFDTTMVHQGYIEPHNAVAQYNQDGKATVWVSTQGPFAVRELCGTMLQINRGGYQSCAGRDWGRLWRQDHSVFRTAGPASVQTHRPPGEKWSCLGARVLRATGPTPGSHIRAKIGVNIDGQDHRGRTPTLIRGRCFSWFARCGWLHDRSGSIRLGKFSDRRV